MHSLLIKPSKKTLSKSQATFNRLIKKIEKSQNKIKKTEEMLNQGLHYYHSKVFPAEQRFLDKLTACIPVFYSYYRNLHTKITKNEREILKDLIQNLLGRLANYVTPHDVSEEIISIIQDIEGVNFKDVVNSEFDSLKKEMSSFAQEEGINIDLSSLHSSDSKEELLGKFQKILLDAVENKKNEELNSNNNMKQKVKKKTKKQLMKEQHERELDQINKKGLSQIYKQLARALHPDLELDPELKREKEVLMKKLTVAYDNQDLHTLLSIEIEWMNRNASDENENHIQKAEEQLKVYNTLLKDQIKSLEHELNMLFMHPRYFDMHHILEEYPFHSPLEALEEEEEELLRDARMFSSAIDELKDGSNVKRIREILKEFSTPSIFDMLQFY